MEVEGQHEVIFKIIKTNKDVKVWNSLNHIKRIIWKHKGKGESVISGLTFSVLK